ncbi:MAG TPA: hypothetical protein DIT63_07615 [Gammaproteobacteria bacterium]|nr:hypothetical protein [Gammaproteobacteria bacterium]
MTETATLPAAFAALQPYVDTWALADENSRFHKRINAPLEELRVFYDAIAPHMEAVMQHLQGCPVAGLPAADEALLRLALSYAEVSRVFEVWQQQDVRADFFDPARLRCVGFEAAQA